jgi:hypothetical protein
VPRSYDAEKTEIKFDGGDSINANGAMVAPMVVSAFGGSLESGGRFCTGAFGKNSP